MLEDFEPETAVLNSRIIPNEGATGKNEQELVKTSEAEGKRSQKVKLEENTREGEVKCGKCL